MLHIKNIYFTNIKSGEPPRACSSPKVKNYKPLFFHAPYRGGGVQNGSGAQNIISSYVLYEKYIFYEYQKMW